MIGTADSCFVIAEIGVNHDGSVAKAHELVDAAAVAGADAVKIQTFAADALAAEDAPKAEYQKREEQSSTQLEMLRGLELDESAHRELQTHAAERGLVFMSSPFDHGSVELLRRIGIVAFKVPSGEITNHGMLRLIAEAGLPVVMSTGMSTLEEVEAAAAVVIEHGAPLALLHCVSEYPADPGDCNLRAMDTLRRRFDCPVGWSDHTAGIAISIAAAALGADIIEKHVTLDRRDAGPDHAASIEPSELARLVEGVSAARRALGSGIKRPTPGEQTMAEVVRKSLHWRRGLGPGHVVSETDLVALRPGTGLPPARIGELIGRRLRREVVGGARAQEQDFEQTK